MQRLPVKSTERKTIHNNLVTYTRKDDLNSNNNLSTTSTTTKTILKIIIVIISIAAGTAICSSVVYFFFLKKEETESDKSSSNSNENNENGSNSNTLKVAKVIEKKFDYKCNDIFENCNECKEIYSHRNLAVKPKEVETEVPTEEPTLSSIICISCQPGYYPIYDENEVILFCNKFCQTGDAELCKTCDSKNQNQCGICNIGYYLPTDDISKSKCKKCSDLIDNCGECYGSKNSIVCTSCNNNYFLSKEKNICESLCITGPDNFCKTCNIETNQCQTCNPGYYLPSDEENRKMCKKCSDINDKCEECYGTKNSVKCLSCKNGYIPSYNNKNEILECNLPCTTGPDYSCKTCDMEKNQCNSCNDGYYLPSDDFYKLKCKKCTDIVKNCKECHGELNSVTCDYFLVEDKLKCGLTCQIGKNEKCLTCNYDKNQCNSCNKKYYLPSDDYSKLECKRCDDLIDYCEECFGTLERITCTKCMENYFLFKDENTQMSICKLNKIIQCETGSGEKCLTCDEEKHICNSCNNGYYLPSDDEQKIKCQKCSIDNCQICQGTKSSNICTKCNINLRAIYENSQIKECKEYVCQTGPNEKCLTCDNVEDICSSCNMGYYLPTDSETKLECQKCSLENCQACEGTKSSDICTLCKQNYSPVYQDGVIVQCKEACKIGPEDQCKTCHETENLCTSCNLGYKLENGICKLNYSFRATYINESPYEKISIIYTFSTYIKAMIVDGEELQQTSFPTYYHFPDVKVHEVYVLIDIPSHFSNYDNLFYDCQNMLTIHFTPLFNTSHVESMILMFGQCYNLNSIDLSVFDTRKVVRMNRMFALCHKLTSIDITNFNTEKVVEMNEMFSQCYSLTSVDLSNLKSPKLTIATAFFSNCYSITSIDLSHIQSLFLKDIQQFFDNCFKLEYVNLSNVYTDSVTTTSKMFRNCTSLNSVDFSSFNTKILKDMDNMFESCSSLTSINIWQFTTNNCISFNNIFKGCSNLKYINMASSTYKYNSDIFNGVPNGGTIIVHPNRIDTAEKYLKSKEWNIIEATEYKA